MLIVDVKTEEGVGMAMGALGEFPPGDKSSLIKHGEHLFEGPDIAVSPSRLRALSDRFTIKLY